MHLGRLRGEYVSREVVRVVALTRDMIYSSKTRALLVALGCNERRPTENGASKQVTGTAARPTSHEVSSCEAKNGTCRASAPVF